MKLFQATFATGILPVAAAEAIRVASAEAVAAKAAARFNANTTVFAPSVVVPAAPKVAGNDVGVVFRRAAAVAAPAATADSFQAILSAVRACANVSEYDAAVAQAAVADGCATPAQRKLAEQSALIQRNMGRAAIALAQLQAAPAKAVAKAPAKAKASVMELPKAAPAVKVRVRAPIGFAAHVEAVKAAAVRKAAAKAAYVAKTASVRKGKGGGSSRKIGRNVRKAVAAKAVVAKAMALTAISRMVPAVVETAIAPSAAADWARIVASMAKYPRASRHITGTVYETQYTDGTSEVRQFTFKGEFVVSSVLV